MGKHKKPKNNARLLQQEQQFITSLNTQVQNGIRSMTNPLGAVETCQEMIAKHYPGKQPDTTTRESTFAEFTTWLKDNGAPLGDVSFVELDPHCYGIVCNTDVDEEQTVLSVPRALMMSSEDVYQLDTPLGVFVNANPLTKSMQMVTLALYLLHHKQMGEQSFYHSYIRSLPQNFPTLPLYWTARQMRFLEKTTAFSVSVRRYLECVGYYCHLFTSMFQIKDPAKRPLNLQQFTFGEFQWAMAIAMTRQNPIPSLSSGQMFVGLIPVFDMCNHEDGRYTTSFDTETAVLTCTAMRNFAKGEEFHIFYGNRSNLDLLIYCGFVMDPGQNKYDKLDFTLALPEDDPLGKIKALLLNKMNIPCDSEKVFYHFTATPDEPLSAAMLDFARVSVLDKEEAAEALKTSMASGLGGRPLGPANEERALAYLIQLLEQLVATPETSADVAESDKLSLQLADRLLACEVGFILDAVKGVQEMQSAKGE